MPGVHTRVYKDGYYRGWYRDATGTRRFFRGSSDYKETLQAARAKQAHADLVRIGLLPAVDPLPADPFVDTARQYLEWGKVQGGIGGRPWSPVHARMRTRHLVWWDEQLQVRLVSDLLRHKSRLDQAMTRLVDLALSPRTRASYVERLRAFCLWCVERGYLMTNPTDHISRRLSHAPQTTRRALGPEEIHRLLAVVPAHRRLLYETALYTGLRVNELRNLTVFHLDRTRLGLKLDAAWTKNRKAGFQPLPAHLMPALEAFAERQEATRLYEAAYRHARRVSPVRTSPLLYVPSNPTHRFEQDLRRAGIPKKTHEGVLVFHSLRNTFATLIDSEGASAKDNQALMRHATPHLTMYYAQSREERQRRLLDQAAQRLQTRSQAAPGPERAGMGSAADPSIMSPCTTGETGTAGVCTASAGYGILTVNTSHEFASCLQRRR